jgi:hypothetical protein
MMTIKLFFEDDFDFLVMENIYIGFDDSNRKSYIVRKNRRRIVGPAAVVVYRIGGKILNDYFSL